VKGEASREKIAYVIPTVGKGVRQRKGSRGKSRAAEERWGYEKGCSRKREVKEKTKRSVKGRRDEVVERR
jgi:hypothetical protein